MTVGKVIEYLKKQETVENGFLEQDVFEVITSPYGDSICVVFDDEREDLIIQ